MLKIKFELQASTELASRYVHDVAWANFLTNPYGKSPNVKADVEAQIKEACRTIRYAEHGNKTLDELGAATVIVRYVLLNDVYHSAIDKPWRISGARSPMEEVIQMRRATFVLMCSREMGSISRRRAR